MCPDSAKMTSMKERPKSKIAIKVIQSGGILVLLSIVVSLVTLWSTYGKVADCLDKDCSITWEQKVSTLCLIFRDAGLILILIGVLYYIYAQRKHTSR